MTHPTTTTDPVTTPIPAAPIPQAPPTTPIPVLPLPRQQPEPAPETESVLGAMPNEEPGTA